MILVTYTPAVGEASAVAAALAVVAARTPGVGSTGAALLIDLGPPRPWRDTVLAADAARRLAQGVGRHATGATLRVRGSIAVAIPAAEGGEPLDLLSATDDCGQPRVVHLAPGALTAILDARPATGVGVLLRCSRGRDSSLAGAAAIELRRRGVPVKVWSSGLGGFNDRRARAGLEPGAGAAERSRRAAAALMPPQAHGRRPPALKHHLAASAEAGQALPAVLGLLGMVAALALALAALGGAETAKGRAQRAVDLAAVSSARSMRDDFPRLFVAPLREDGTPNPDHLSRARYLARAEAGAAQAAEKNGLDPGSIRVRFPGGDSIAPLEVEVRARPGIEVQTIEVTLHGAQANHLERIRLHALDT